MHLAQTSCRAESRVLGPSLPPLFSGATVVLLADAARFARRSLGDRWFADETYVKVNRVWRYVTGPLTSTG